MSRLFETHRMTVMKNEIVKVDRQPVSTMTTVISGVPCRVTGTDNSNIKVFILAKHYDTIPGGLHKNFQIVLEGDFVQTYSVTKEPIWAGGKRHHIEAHLEEAK
jgi:hypothetical protein